MGEKHLYKTVLFLSGLALTQSVNSDHGHHTNILDYTTATSVFLDTDSKSIQVTNSTFNFLGKSYSTIYANKYGSLSFGSTAGHPHFGLTCKTSRFDGFAPKIAVFLRKVHQSQLFYENIEYSRAPDVFQSVQEDVSKSFPLYSGKLTKMLVLTWTTVPGQNDSYINTTFQGVLATDNVNTFVILNVNMIDSQCNVKYLQPIAGFNGGFHNRELEYLIPGTCKSLCYFVRNSNIGQRGKYIFKVDKTLEHPSVTLETNIKPQLISLVPRVVPMTGSVPLIAHGIDMVQDYNLTKATCTFKDQNTVLYEYKDEKITNHLDFLRCETPVQFDRLGKIDVFLNLTFADHPELNFQSFVFVEKVLRPTPQIFIRDSWMLSFSWDSKNIINSDVNDLHLINTGFAVRQNMAVNITILHLNSTGWNDVLVLAGKPNWGHVDMFRQGLDGALTNMTGPKSFKISTRHDPVFFSTTHYLSWTELAGDVFNTTVALDSHRSQADHDKQCQELYDNEELSPTDTLPCPFTLNHAFLDWRFTYNGPEPDALKFTQNTPSPSGSGAVCSYSWRGNLVSGTKHGSFIQHYSAYNKFSIWKHYKSDIMPCISCCVFENLNKTFCDRFMKKRSVSTDYQYPAPFMVGGVNQIVTPEGSSYRLNKTGPFWLFKAGNISVQISSENYSSKEHVTVTTAVAIALAGHQKTSFKIFSVNAGIQIWMDNEPVNFYKTGELGHFNYMRDNFTIYENEYTVFINGTKSALFSMSEGIAIKITPNRNSTSLNIIGGFSHTVYTSHSGLLFGFGDGRSLDTFMEQWRVSPEQIMLHLPTEISHPNNRRLMTKPVEENLSNATEKCLQVKECTVDFNLTQNADFAMSSLIVHMQFEKMRKLLSKADITEPNSMTNIAEEWNIVTSPTGIVDQENLNHSTISTFDDEKINHSTTGTVGPEIRSHSTTEDENINHSTISIIDEEDLTNYTPGIVNEDDHKINATDILGEEDKKTKTEEAHAKNFFMYLLLGVSSVLVIVILVVIYVLRKRSADVGKTENFIINYSHSFNNQ